MVAGMPGALVAAPAVTPLPFGLFSAITFRGDGDRWQNGIQWESIGGCELIAGIAAWDCSGTTLGLPKDLDGPPYPEDTEATEFTVYGTFRCSPVGYNQSTAQAKADANLVKWEQNRVEQALWTGDLGNVPNLTGANGSLAPTVITPTVDTLEGAIASLEGYIGTVLGEAGVIHMTRHMALLAIETGVVEVKGNRLQTKLGTTVIAGAGYPGTAPDGNISETTTWMYATAPLFGYRSDIFDSSNIPGDLFDRGQNNLHTIAERTYLVAFDLCGIGAVDANLGGA